MPPKTTRQHITCIPSQGWGGDEPRLVGDEHTELGWLPVEAAADLRDLALAEYQPLFRTLLEVPKTASAGHGSATL
jgi:hypothetical protein